MAGTSLAMKYSLFPMPITTGGPERAATILKGSERAITAMREIDLLQSHLHDDVAEFVYERMRRRPMVLPVVVEV